jgi:hypothetical protein
MSDPLVYTPPASVIPFLVSEKFISLIVGPLGSTKTTAGLMKIAYHAARMARCRDGIRRSRAVWVRNTREQLRDTSIPDFLKWFPDGVAGIFEKTNYKFLLKFDDVECEVLFRGLDEAADVRRLLSLQASFAIFDEFREINQDIFETMQGRLGRYPDGMLVPHRPEWGVDDKGHPIQGCVTDEGKPNKHAWGQSNPPDMDTYWANFINEHPENVVDVFIQPSGLDPKADWVQFLPSNYYEDLAEGKSEDWIDVYIRSKFGKSLSGRAVYTGFNFDFHVSKTPLTPIKSMAHSLIIGADFGLNPSMTINQIDPKGRFLTYAAVTSDGMGLTRFVAEKLKPLLAETRFRGLPVIIVGDPAGSQRAQTDERSCFDILKAAGFNVIPARTNSTVARVGAVEYLLMRQIEGGPARLIDPSAKVLINAYRGGYRYKIRKDGQAEDAPEKNLHSHIADADQYACLHADGGVRGNVMPVRREVVVARASGWT